jgi:hypothetical protein
MRIKWRRNRTGRNCTFYLGGWGFSSCSLINICSSCIGNYPLVHWQLPSRALATSPSRALATPPPQCRKNSRLCALLSDPMVCIGLGTEFRSEKIPRNRLGMASVIPRKKALIPRYSEFRGRANSEARNGMERNKIPRKKLVLRNSS